jgi:hypothetical protein
MYASVALQRHVVKLMSLHLEQLLQRAAQGSLTSYELLVSLMWLHLVGQLLQLWWMIREPSQRLVLDQQSNRLAVLQVQVFVESSQPGIPHIVYEQQMRSRHSYRTSES